jgi:hypothetical protein
VGIPQKNSEIMKYLFLFCFVCLSGVLKAQTWQSMLLNTSAGLGILPPYEGFKLNPYTNDLWFLHPTKVSCLRPDGSVHYLDIADLTVNGNPCYPDIAFTPLNPYFSNEDSGLYRVNADFSKTMVYNATYSGHIFSNMDTIYMDLYSSAYLSYTSNVSFTTPISFNRIEAKGPIKYPAYGYNSAFVKYTGNGNNGYEQYGGIDPADYFCNQFHDAKFSRLTDTFYVSCAAGINKAINYDFYESLTPATTTDMPSANVIEFEFDALDRLWAVFATTDNVPFALARLDGDTWTNRYDASNCPVNFANYKGLEIDTLGNLWVSESFYLHTLLTPNSPQWLGTGELSMGKLQAYPNPALEELTFELPKAGGVVQVSSISGALVFRSEGLVAGKLTVNSSAWPKGCYVANWSDGEKSAQLLIVK